MLAYWWATRRWTIWGYGNIRQNTACSLSLLPSWYITPGPYSIITGVCVNVNLVLQVILHLNVPNFKWMLAWINQGLPNYFQDFEFQEMSILKCVPSVFIIFPSNVIRYHCNSSLQGYTWLDYNTITPVRVLTSRKSSFVFFLYSILVHMKSKE